MHAKLTVHQASLIRSFVREAKAVRFYGFDQNALPVIGYEDAHGWHEPFAILRRPYPTHLPRLNIQTEVTVGIPAPPYEPYDIETIDPESHELLCRLTRAFPG